MELSEGWKEALLAEMDRRFRICDGKGRLHDDALATDDTQIGVEFAIDFIGSLGAAAPTPPAQERSTWKTNGDTCLNCGKRITQHEDQTFCPPAQEDEPTVIPEVIAYKSTAIPESQWKKLPVDEWLKRWIDDCDYHESLVYEAIIKFCESIRTRKTIAISQDDEPVAEVIDGEVIWLSSPGEVKDGELLYTRPKS